MGNIPVVSRVDTFQERVTYVGTKKIVKYFRREEAFHVFLSRPKRFLRILSLPFRAGIVGAGFRGRPLRILGGCQRAGRHQRRPDTLERRREDQRPDLRPLAQLRGRWYVTINRATGC